VTASLALSWDDGNRRRLVAIVLCACALYLSLPAFAAPLASALAAGSQDVAVVVQAVPGAEHDVSTEVNRLGGRPGRSLDIVHGFSARIPAASLPILRRYPGVMAVSSDRHLHLLASSYSQAADVNSLYNIAKQVGAERFYNSGFGGKGVDVALIDSGVARVAGLSGGDKIVNGPDLSFDSQSSASRYVDGFGHGTHMAGIIAGRDASAGSARSYSTDSTDFLGVAPDARIVSVKVADSYGNTDVSQVIAAIDWVVQHRNDKGLNIRILNLSFGTNSGQEYVVDPLAFAAEAAWHAGIVVVAAAGNGGGAQPTQAGNDEGQSDGSGPSAPGLSNPAYDPWLIAVGGAESDSGSGTRVASFSSSGSQSRPPDLVAPGAHVQSLRAPGSYVDSHYSNTGLINSRFFRGTGTSQATAVVSGAAALVLQQRPDLNPDQVKALLKGTATDLHDRTVRQGNGALSLATAYAATTPARSAQSWILSRGDGLLELARGGVHLVRNDTALSGERDIFGHSFNARDAASATDRGVSWSRGSWNGTSWTGTSWTGTSWTGTSWTGTSWSGTSWSGSSWTGSSWTGCSWSGWSWG
jgi:serine protease AprX